MERMGSGQPRRLVINIYYVMVMAVLRFATAAG